MPHDSDSPPAPQNTLGTLVRLALIGVFVLCVVTSFAYAAGWLSPNRLTQTRIVNAFQKVNGTYPGFRRNHAKGICVAGYFDSGGAGESLSKAVVFKPGRVPVIGRFSLSGGNPYIPDGPTAVRGMGLAFRPSNGDEWRMAMVDLPVFPFRNAQGFYENLLASKPDPVTGKPDPHKVKVFLANHPETLRAFAIIKANPLSSGFDNATYNSLNAFRFVNAAGVSTPVRWAMIPADPFKPDEPSQSALQNKDYLFDALVARVYSSPVRWHLIVTVGQPADPTDNATIPWSSAREHIDAGTLNIDQIKDEEQGRCDNVNFDPLVLPSGIAPSDDPLLSARSAVYSQSFTRREGEKKSPTALQSLPGKGA
jgi:catalase